MPSGKQTVHTYEELADREERRANPQMRDRFLILAADAALTNGLREEAERLRGRLLQHNPHHLLRPYPSLLEAIRSPDVSSYIADLRHSYPPDEAFRLLEELRACQDDAGTQAVENRPEPPSHEESDEAETLADPAGYRFPEPPEPKLLAEEPTAPPPRPKIDLTPPPPKPRPEPPRKPATPKWSAPAAVEETVPPVPAPEVYPYPAQPPLPRSRSRPDAEPDDMPSALSIWMGNVLFSVLLLAGLGLLVWTFARPFLPL